MWQSIPLERYGLKPISIPLRRQKTIPQETIERREWISKGVCSVHDMYIPLFNDFITESHRPPSFNSKNIEYLPLDEIDIYTLESLNSLLILIKSTVTLDLIFVVHRMFSFWDNPQSIILIQTSPNLIPLEIIPFFQFITPTTITNIPDLKACEYLLYS